MPGRVVAACIGACASVLIAVMPAAAITLSNSIATPTPATPASARTAQPAPSSPYDEVVGGARLGISGVPVVADGVAAPAVDGGRAWLVADLTSGRVLAALSPHDRLPPASTIKLLTAIALLPEINVDATYVATDADVTVEGSKVGLVPGQSYSRDALVHGLLLASGNDAANALAQLAGGQARALSLIAEEASRLGAFDTTATTTHGLDEPQQLTSAYDLALVARAVLADPDLATVVRTETYDFPGLSGETFQIQNHNRLVGSYVGALGLKTGFTTISEHTLVAAAERDGVTLVAVVLGAENRAEPIAGTLLDWGFSQRADVEPIGRLVTQAEVAAAVREQNSASPQPTADQPVEQDAAAVSAGNEPATPMPLWAWAGLLVAVVGSGIVMTRRQRTHGDVVRADRRARRRGTNASAARRDRRRARRH